MNKKKSVRTVSYDKYKAFRLTAEIAQQGLIAAQANVAYWKSNYEQIDKQLAAMKDKYENRNMAMMAPSPDQIYKEVTHKLLSLNFEDMNRVIAHVMLDVRAYIKNDLRRMREKVFDGQVQKERSNEDLIRTEDAARNLEIAINANVS